VRWASACLEAAGTLENRASYGRHEIPCTIRRYDRTGDEIARLAVVRLDEGSIYMILM